MESPYEPPNSKASPKGQAGKRPQGRAGCIIAVILSLLGFGALYYSMFWGWASGAGSPPNADALFVASRVAFGIAMVAGLASIVVGIRWLVRR